MNSALFPHLFQPITIGTKTVKNRIMSSGHDTYLPVNGLVSDAYIAYQEARAKGGTGLIVTQVAGIHETARYTSHLIMATNDACVRGYAELAQRCQAHGATVVSQLFHPGREIIESADGLLAVAYAPSAVPNERFHVMPRPLNQTMIDEIIAGYAAGAKRMQQAGLDGVEYVASHGYLPSQFLSEKTNRRTDEYGGSIENRVRFLQQCLQAMRKATGENFIIGMRLSLDEKDDLVGIAADEWLQAIPMLNGLVDYYSVTCGTSASLGAAVHITAPMAYNAAYVAPYSAQLKQLTNTPVFVTGRINQPHEAELLIANGSADICGMTRALICDPEMPAKAEQGRTDDIRACIACNQACIGHFHRGLPISCIQHPETGRELSFGTYRQVDKAKSVMVIGGGPAGMKAAATAAQRGHNVTLHEAEQQLGGQAVLAQLLPGRTEFGGIITNLKRECELAGVTFKLSSRVDLKMIEAEKPEAIIFATGAVPYIPHLETDDSIDVMTAWDVLEKRKQPHGNVVVADWKSDWIGAGLAQKLTSEGHYVRMAVNAPTFGEALPLYVRDTLAATMHRMQIPVTLYARVFGTDQRSAYFQHTTSGEPIVFEDVDTMILSTGHKPQPDFIDMINNLEIPYQIIGDALAPRTAEEAVFEGMCAGDAI
ncbi:FAD-dependent oxidoreductase (plasmid) [Brucella sp. 6810]|nr:FAD-dependent oxidoreductase [Brucella sp. 6810]QNQ64477.1 FAD-dependent oxidoreductase [Brucella sp. 6810]